MWLTITVKSEFHILYEIATFYQTIMFVKCFVISKPIITNTMRRRACTQHHYNSCANYSKLFRILNVWTCDPLIPSLLCIYFQRIVGPRAYIKLNEQILQKSSLVFTFHLPIRDPFCTWFQPSDSKHHIHCRDQNRHQTSVATGYFLVPVINVYIII